MNARTVESVRVRVSVCACTYTVMHEMLRDRVIYCVLLYRSNAGLDVTVCVCECVCMLLCVWDSRCNNIIPKDPRKLLCLSLKLFVAFLALYILYSPIPPKTSPTHSPCFENFCVLLAAIVCGEMQRSYCMYPCGALSEGVKLRNFHSESTVVHSLFHWYQLPFSLPSLCLYSLTLFYSLYSLMFFPSLLCYSLFISVFSLPACFNLYCIDYAFK